MRMTYKYTLTVVQIHNSFTTLVYSTQALGLLICYVTRTRVLSTCDFTPLSAGTTAANTTTRNTPITN